MELTELKSHELLDDMYVVMKQESQPHSFKVRLGQLKKYMLGEIESSPDHIKQTSTSPKLFSWFWNPNADSTYSRHSTIGGISRY